MLKRLAERFGLGGRRVRAALLVLLAAASLLCALLSGPGLRYPDEGDYWALAGNVAARGAYSLDGERPTASRPPAYPLVLAGVRLAGGGPLAAKALNTVFLLLAAAAASRFFLARGRPVAAALVVVFVAAYPLFLHTASTLYPQTLGVCLLACFFVLLLRAPEGAAVAAAAGAGFALLALAIPVFAALLPVALAVPFLCAPPRRAARAAAVLLTAAALVVAPWAARNAAALGAPVFLSTNGGLNLLLGNSPGTRPDSGVNVEVASLVPGAESRGEVERDALFRRAAVRWIRGNPGRAARLYAGKFVHHFSFRNELATASERAVWKEALLFATYLPHLGLLGARLVLRRRWPLEPWERAALLLYVGFAAASAVFFTRIRFRAPSDLLLLMLSASFAARFLGDGDAGSCRAAAGGAA